MRKSYYFLFIFSLLLLNSCSGDESLDVNDTVVNQNEENKDTDNNDNKTPENEISENRESTPCDFDLSKVTAGQKIEINCTIDLKGELISIPSDVYLKFNGGDIINGELNFSDNGKIDSELLNASLELKGNILISTDEFELIPSRWNIIEGKVSDKVAENNKLNINETFAKVKSLGAFTIKIDKLDAFFYNVPGFKQRPQDVAIQVPANTNLLMTDNTHLRTQPNNFKNTVLLTLFMADNSIVDGGILHGDRDEHDYSSGGTHEWGHLILIKATKDSTIKNVTMMDAGGDGLNINALGHSFDKNYTFSSNLTITNNKIIRARRNGISLTDGRDIIIEENELIDSGVPTSKSNGTAPQWAIDIEPIWSQGKKFEIVENITIRKNIERGSEKGGIINARGYYITYEDNEMESTIAIGETVGSIVRNNTFKNPTKNSVAAIVAGLNDSRGHGNERNSDNQVYGNKIFGFDKGIFLQDPGIDLHSNIITNCKSGIQILNTRNSKIRDNTIINEIGESEGIANKVSQYIDDLVISGNIVKVQGSPFRFTNVNLGEEQTDFKITIEKNTVTSLGNNASSFNKIRGFDFIENINNNSGIRTINASLGNISGNTFTNSEIRISQGCADLDFTENTITGGSCFYDDNTDAVNIVKRDNNCDN